MQKKYVFLGIIILGVLTLALSKKQKNTHAFSAELEEELAHAPLVIEGTIPSWLTGTLLRNGPIGVTVDGKSNAHWFDGLAMLHAFSFQGEKVYYTNRFLRTDAYAQVFEKGSLQYDGFAVDPCRSLFKRFFTWFVPHSKPDLHNANVNIAKLAEQYVALTETPLPIHFDPKTLETLGVLNFQDTLPKDKCWESAHPHGGDGEVINYLIQYGYKSHYTLYRITDDSPERKVIAQIPVQEPAYMHSFALTKNYVVFTEFPFVVKPLDLITKGKAFIKNFEWHPELGTQFIVVDRHDGKVVGKYKTGPFFAFHHVNAFEDGDNLILDIICYDDAEVIAETADHFKANADREQEQQILTRLDRYTLSLKTGEITSKTILEEAAELPRINEAYDGLPYRYAYLTDPREAISESDIRPLYKVDTVTNHVLRWSEKGCYPGEPVFVAAPDAKKEDEGAILAVILDLYHHNSFLLVLDGQTFTELGRARVSHAIPAGLHGQYYQGI